MSRPASSPLPTLRVLFMIAEFHRFTGSQRQLLTFLQHAPTEDLHPLAVFPGEGACVQAFRTAGVPVEVLPAPPVLNQFGQVLMRASLLRKALLFLFHVLPYSFLVLRLMRARRAQVLHCNSARALLLAAVAPSLAGYPVVWHIRGQTGSLGNFLRRCCEVLGSRIVTNARVLADSLSPGARLRSQTVYDAAVRPVKATTAELPASAREFLHPLLPVVAMFASITPFKGYHYLVEAARQVSLRWPQNPPVFLAIGVPEANSEIDSRYEAYLRALIEQAGLSNWHFLGWQPDPTPFYAAADIVVLPSLEFDSLVLDGAQVEVRGNEGFPTTILEAMSFGKPVVGTRNAGIPEQIVDGETGLLVPQRDAASLASALVRLLEDPELRQQMGQNAKARANGIFTTEKTVEQMLAIFREVA